MTMLRVPILSCTIEITHVKGALQAWKFIVTEQCTVRTLYTIMYQLILKTKNFNMKACAV